MDKDLLLTVLIALVSGLIVLGIILKSQKSNTIEKKDAKGAARLKTYSAIEQARPLSDLELEAAVASLVRSAKKIEAIKLIRENREVGLKDAKDMVDELERSGQLPGLAGLARTGLQTGHATAAAAPAGQEYIVSLLRKGEKIMAIKELRDETGLGLKEAKDEIDRLARLHGL